MIPKLACKTGQIVVTSHASRWGWALGVELTIIDGERGQDLLMTQKEAQADQRFRSPSEVSQ